MKKIVIAATFFFALFYVKISCATVSSIMLDAESGDIMYEMNADEKRYPASLTKLMTLYITFNALENKHIKLSDQLKVSRTAAGRSPSKLGVRAGETISVEDAIMAVIVKSANDCATVLAEHFSKTEADFAVLMTQTAKKLGMKDTTFKNASGLPNSKQKTTARDMSILAMAIYHHFPQYYKWFSANTFMYKGHKVYGHNHVLKTFKGADGMKTGYTAASGYNIITSAKRDGKRVIAVTMGHRYLNERDKKVSLMMDRGLTHMQQGKEIDVAMLAQEINKNKASSVKSVSARTIRVAKAKIAPVPAKKSQYAKVQSPVKSTLDNAVDKDYTASEGRRFAIQVGSFSDYKRARNYALTVKNKLAKKYAVYDIDVEKVSSQTRTVYRSKVVGLAKNEASQICRSMKRQKQSCLVTRDNSSIKMATY